LYNGDDQGREVVAEELETMDVDGKPGSIVPRSVTFPQPFQ
jgi:hypothetical protein